MSSRFNPLHRLALILGLLVTWPGASLAQSTVLENVLISKSGGTASVEIRFSCPHRYIDHFPLAASDRAQINLTPLDQCGRASAMTPDRQSRRPAGRNLAALRELEFQSRGPGEAFLLLRFDRPVTIAAHQRGDLRGLTITVEVPEGDAAPEQTVSPAIAPLDEEQTTSRPLRTPERLQRANDRARQELAKSNDVAEPAKGSFAINLQSAREPISEAQVGSDVLSADGRLYLQSVTVEGETWYRLRLGFFGTEAEAEQALQQLRPSYPKAWIVRVASPEYAAADSNPVAPAASGTLATAGTVAREATPNDGLPAITDERLAELMAEGRAALLAGDHNRAIQVYTKVLREPEHPRSRDAQEMLGLARDRNGQQAHAIAEYRRYLLLYPEGEGAARVQQRLAGLTAVKTSPHSPRRTASRSRRESRWELFGGASQYYRRDVNQFDDRDQIVSQSSVLSNFDVVARRLGDRFDFTSRATLGNLYDLLGDDEGPGNSTRIYYLYADLADEHHGLAARLGRQSLHTGGVLGRFDGGYLSWQWRPTTRFNLVSGFPVDTTDDRIDTGRVFYGFSTDLTQVLDLVDLSFFYNTQEVDGIKDREAIGSELRYFDGARSLITTLDYDLAYGEINSIVMLGNWRFENRLTLHAMADFRKSPFLLTRNALIGQPVTTIDDLLLTLKEEEIRELAMDRTGEMQTFALGATFPLFERFQLNADVTMTNYDGTSASGGVAAVPDLDAELYYSLNLIGSSLLKGGDISIFGLRYADATSSSTTTASIDTRYPLTDGLRINPRLQFSYREFDFDQSEQWIATPSLRLLYRFARRYRLEVEVGGEWSDRELAEGSSDYSAYFIYAGYRADF